MITLSWGSNPQAEIQALMAKFDELPRHIAKKHLQAAMRRTLKDGVPVLRRLTPPVGVTRGRKAKGAVRTTGALRRACTTKAKYIGRNADGLVYGVVGYKYGIESRKALWLDKGTVRIKPRQIISQFMASYGGPSGAKLAAEMAAALEKAANELNSGKNPGWRPS